MSYGEKRTIVSTIAEILILAAYSIYVIGKVNEGMIDTEDLQFWAVTMLVFFVASIVVMIVIQIIFAIILAFSTAVRESVSKGCLADEKALDESINAEFVEDELDKLIAMKSQRFGYAVAGFGFIAGLVSLVLAYTPAVMLNLIFAFWFLAQLTDGIVSIYYYRKGVRYG